MLSRKISACATGLSYQTEDMPVQITKALDACDCWLFYKCNKSASSCNTDCSDYKSSQEEGS